MRSYRVIEHSQPIGLLNLSMEGSISRLGRETPEAKALVSGLTLEGMDYFVMFTDFCLALDPSLVLEAGQAIPGKSGAGVRESF